MSDIHWPLPTTPGRIGLILPETPTDGAMILANRLIQKFNRMVDAKIVAGVANFPDDAITDEDLVDRAKTAVMFALDSNELVIDYGSFEGQNIPVGTYVLIIHHETHSPFIKKGVVIGESRMLEELRCEMGSGCRIEGVLKVGNDDTRGYHVCPWIDPIGIYWYAGGVRLTENGSFSLHGLPYGLTRIVVTKGSEAVFETTVKNDKAAD